MATDKAQEPGGKGLLTKANLKAFLLVNLGVLLLTVGVYFFKLPNNFTTGGVSGLAILLSSVIPFLSTATLMPLIWGGIVLAAASAFTVTTGDSYLLSGASNFTIDIYKTKINPNATPKQEMRTTRLFILIAGVLAYVILQFFPSVLAVQYWSYTIYGAGITPAVFCALVWPKVTKAGGIASMLIGTALTIVWEALGMPFGIQTVIIALPVSAIVIVVVSLLTQPKQAAQA